MTFGCRVVRNVYVQTMQKNPKMLTQTCERKGSRLKEERKNSLIVNLVK